MILGLAALSFIPQAAPAEPTTSGSAVESTPFVERVGGKDAGTLFEDLPTSRTGIDFQLRLPETPDRIQELIHLSVYGGVATGDFDGDGLADIYAASPLGGSRLYRNLGDFRFEDVTVEAGVSDPKFWGTGATFVDIDNDGDLDIYACGYRMPNRLFVNQGADDAGKTRFVERAGEFGLAFNGASMLMAFADIDNDGNLDGYLATTAAPPPPGVKFRVEYLGNRPVVPKELEEYWALLYLPGERVTVVEAGQRDRLFRNDGGRFIDVTDSAGISGAHFTLAAIWWDVDGDGDADLYVANDYFGPDILYRNNGDGTFSNIISDAVRHIPWSSMGTDIADLNNDGRIDLMATDMLGSTHFRRQVMMGESTRSAWFLEYGAPRQYVRNAVYLNTGQTRFMEAAYLTGLAATDWTWGPRLEDFDNDGRVDVFIANGMTRDVQHADLAEYADKVMGGGSAKWAEHWIKQPMLKEANLAFRNLGDLRFERTEEAWGLGRVGVSFGSATADFDNDGDLDLIVSNGDAPLSVYRNGSRESNSIRIQLRGKKSNRFGLGATIRLRAGGLEQTRYLTLARAWLSASEPVLHFGLGSATTADELTVKWPGGFKQSFTGLAANKLHTITEPENSEARRPAETATPVKPYFVESDLLRAIPRQEEAPHDDLSIQPLLPQKLSERGFCMAWGDVNGDGKEDLYLGGGAGAPGRLFLAGEFEQMEQPAFVEDSLSEDVAAVFFDFDQDGDLDLYVVSGGVKHPAGDAAYQDRLYLNQKGTFERAPDGVVPQLLHNGSCVVVADFDQDKDVDLFIGGGAVPGKYPLASPSHLLVNQGGRFEVAGPEALQQAGLVTDAVWADTDSDGWLDLTLTVEWGSVRHFSNKNGRLVETTSELKLGQRTGFWESIATGDLDSDGDIDFVVGNRGLNTHYRAAPTQPEMLFYGDLDGSGESRLLEAYFVDEYAYPHRGLDVMSAAMPSLENKFPSHEAFARAPIEKITTMDHLRKATRREANTLESGILINEGKEGFQFKPLPPLAQIAPARDLALFDVNGDGHLDLLIAQNDYSPRRETGRMDGGVSLLLLGDGRGGFKPLWPGESGISIGDEAKQLEMADVNGDGRLDVVFGISLNRLRVFLAR